MRNSRNWKDVMQSTVGANEKKGQKKGVATDVSLGSNLDIRQLACARRAGRGAVAGAAVQWAGVAGVGEAGGGAGLHERVAGGEAAGPAGRPGQNVAAGAGEVRKRIGSA